MCYLWYRYKMLSILFYIKKWQISQTLTSRSALLCVVTAVG